jgi:hypothetical protein
MMTAGFRVGPMIVGAATTSNPNRLYADKCGASTATTTAAADRRYSRGGSLKHS